MRESINLSSTRGDSRFFAAFLCQPTCARLNRSSVSALLDNFNLNGRSALLLGLLLLHCGSSELSPLATKHHFLTASGVSIVSATFVLVKI